MKSKFLVLWALLIFTGSCQSQAAAKLQQDDSLPLDPAVRYGKLENGFTFYLRKIDNFENAIRFNLVVKAGNDHEDGDQLEHAHLLEHLLFKETKHFPNLSRYFRQAGQSHAFTENRSTSYYVQIPSKDKNLYADGVRVLLDWASGENTWKPESIAVERGAIEGESKTRDPHKTWRRNIGEKEVLKKMGYLSFEPKESLSNLRNFNSEAFYRFYKDWYRPDLQAAIIVGDINVDSLERVIKDKFGVLEGPPNPPDPKKYLDAQTVNFDGKVHFATISDSLESKIHLEILRVRPNFALNPKSRAEYKNMLLQQLYMILLGKRAANLQNQYEPPFENFWANYASGLMAGGQINATQMKLELGSNDRNKFKSEFQKGIKAWKQLHLKIDQTESEEAKNELMEKFRKPHLLNEFFERLQEHFVEGAAAPDPEVEAEMIQDLLKEISISELETFIKENGSLEKDTHFLFFKDKNIEMPAYEVFKEWIKEINTMQLEPLEAPAPPIQTLEDVVEIPTSLTMNDVEVKKNLIGVSTVELPNGIKLVLKPTPPAMEHLKNTISLRAFRPNQVPLDNQEEYLAAQAAPEVITFSGAGPYSKFELERFMRDKQMNLRFKLDREHQLIEGKAKGEDLQELLNLLYLYLEKPRYDQLAFEAWKNNKADDLLGKNRKGSTAFIMEKIEPLWYPQVPVIKGKDLPNLEAQQVFEATKQWFSSLENYTFIITGDFVIENLLPVLVNQFSGFPANKEEIKKLFKNLNFPLKKMEEKLEIKNIDAAYVRLFFPVKVESDLKTQIELQLLTKALNNRIFDRLREGSYSPLVRGDWLDKESNIFTFWIEFDSTPGDEEKMTAWALEEFRNLREKGVDKEWLETTIAKESRNYLNRFSTFNIFDFWQDYLKSKLENREDMENEILKYDTLLRHFTSLEDINTAAKEYLKEEHVQIFIGQPENLSNTN